MINGLASEYNRPKFVKRSCASGYYYLRDTVSKLAVPFPRTNYVKNLLVIVVQ